MALGIWDPGVTSNQNKRNCCRLDIKVACGSRGRGCASLSVTGEGINSRNLKLFLKYPCLTSCKHWRDLNQRDCCVPFKCRSWGLAAVSRNPPEVGPMLSVPAKHEEGKLPTSASYRTTAPAASVSKVSYTPVTHRVGSCAQANRDITQTLFLHFMLLPNLGSWKGRHQEPTCKMELRAVSGSQYITEERQIPWRLSTQRTLQETTFKSVEGSAGDPAVTFSIQRKICITVASQVPLSYSPCFNFSKTP